MSRRLAILHVIADLAPEQGGPAAACRAMAAAMAARGHGVAIYTTDWASDGRLAVPDGRPLAEHGVTFRYFRHRWHWRFPVSAGLYRALMAEVGRFDVVHLHSLYLFHDWATARACRAAGVPYILRPHGAFLPFIRRRGRLQKGVANLLFQDRVTRGAACLHYTSEAEAQDAAPHVFGRPGRVVPLGLDTAALATPGAPPLSARFPELARKRVLLFLGRLAAQKGLDLLIPAFAALAPRYPEWHLLLAGADRGEGERLRRLAAESGVAARVTFAGHLEGQDKLAALQHSELFALPSRGENFGLAAVEAMAAGRPVLVTDRVALWREIAADGAGLVCPPQVAELTAALDRLVGDAGLRARLGRAARELTAPRFDWSRVAPQLEAFYAEAIALGPPV